MERLAAVVALIFAVGGAGAAYVDVSQKLEDMRTEIRIEWTALQVELNDAEWRFRWLCCDMRKSGYLSDSAVPCGCGEGDR